MKSLYIYDTPVGQVGIAEESGVIKNVYLGMRGIPHGIDINHRETGLLEEAGRQLLEYLAGKRKNFTLPLGPEGTVFQKQVWRALLDIPYGETASYKMIAEKIKNFKAYRAVGMANNRNPIPIFIPCHRVIGANGGLVGYGGGLELKKMLLDLEQGIIPPDLHAGIISGIL